jgi:hypothetical protein
MVEEMISALMSNGLLRQPARSLERAPCPCGRIDGNCGTLYATAPCGRVALLSLQAWKGSPAFGYPAKDRRVGIGGRTAPQLIEA